MSPHPEPVQGDQLIEHHKKECNRYTNSFCGTARCLKRGGWVKGSEVSYEAATCEAHETVLKLAELRRVTTALEEMTQSRDKWLAAFNGSEQFQNGPTKRAEAAERDLAALRQERDDWRQAFETANEAIGTMESSHAQALREAFEAGIRSGTEYGPGTIDDAFAAYLASRDGGTAG